MVAGCAFGRRWRSAASTRSRTTGWPCRILSYGACASARLLLADLGRTKAFPTRSSRAEAMNSWTPDGRPGTPPATVLLVDDDEDCRIIYSAILMRAGYRVLF